MKPRQPDYACLARTSPATACARLPAFACCSGDATFVTSTVAETRNALGTLQSISVPTCPSISGQSSMPLAAFEGEG